MHLSRSFSVRICVFNIIYLSVPFQKPEQVTNTKLCKLGIPVCSLPSKKHTFGHQGLKFKSSNYNNNLLILTYLKHKLFIE